MKEGLSAIDSNALLIVFLGLAIVFIVLGLIYFFFKSVVPAALSLPFYLRRLLTGRKNGEKPAEYISGDITAAIALTLYLHFSDTHDEESNVITINKVSRTYSPWSSKLYSMRNRLKN